MTTLDIEKIIGQEQVLKKHNPVCRNVKNIFSDWEHDVISLSESGMLYEFEIKISRSDFLKEKYKERKWTTYQAPIHKKTPNYFFYVCAENLIKVDEIPAFAGLIYVIGDKLVVQKKFCIHKTKHDKLKLLEKVSRLTAEREFLGCSMMRYKLKETEKQLVA